MSRNGPTEFFNISGTLRDVMQCIADGVMHRREIDDRLKISEKHSLRAIDKLREAGMIRVEPARDPARAGMGVRLYRCYPTETGYLMLMLCEQIDRNRASSETHGTDLPAHPCNADHC